MFSYEDWDRDLFCISYYNVIFTEDIGVFKKDEKAIALHMETRSEFALPAGYYHIYSTDQVGKKVKEQKVKLVAAE